MAESQVAALVCQQGNKTLQYQQHFEVRAHYILLLLVNAAPKADLTEDRTIIKHLS